MKTSPESHAVDEAVAQPSVKAPAAPAAGGSTPTAAPVITKRPALRRRPAPGARPNRPSVRPPSRPAQAAGTGGTNLTPGTHGSHLTPPDEKESFFQRFGALLGVGVFVVAVGGYLIFKKPSSPSPALKQEHVVMIAPLPPLPPPKPIPTPPPTKPKEEKMEKETAAEDKAPPKPVPVKAPDAPAPLGTNLKGEGGLAGLGGGNGIGGGTLGGGGPGKAGSRFGWYAGQVQSKITEALRTNPKTKNASLRVEVRIWPDSTGRITRAQLAGSTGDAALDNAIQNGVLTGLQLQEGPPAGMKLPIVLRLTARRP